MRPLVLIVEDDEMLRFLTADVFSMIDTDVVECASADQALEILKENSSFDLVFTDIRMPGKIDGLELAEEIWGRWPDLPVILTSGHMIVQSLPLNSAFISKPWTLDQLTNTVRDRITQEF